ncbi:DUF881 domain-containing protein [Catellatospora vulcania]|uniref:DUF881 domain-containing protein n=1 Tax=Catellatospora vulcania TaxID=1460450 RepID=UPI0012D42F55|nr:DUF881 domain-containing protein [Catellatospora vulcania]
MSDEKTQPIGPGQGDEPTVPLAGAGGDEPTAGTSTAEASTAEPAAEPTAETSDAATPDGAGSPVPGDAAPQARPEPDADGPSDNRRKQISGAGALIGVLLVLLGFTLAVQLKSNSADEGYNSLREEDLYVILADLDSRAERLRQDIAELDATRRELDSGASSREQILKEAQERADDIGILAGTLKAQGTGITLRFSDGAGPITADHLLNAVQELRGAGAEAIQIDGTGGSVRVIASTHFVNAGGGGIEVDGVRLTGPYTVTAIGPEDLDKAMEFRGGVVDDVSNDGGTVIVSDPHPVDITAVRGTPNLEYAKPVS